MSSRKSSSSGEDLPSSRFIVRTPLRSLNNEIQCLSSSSSRFRAKIQLAAEPVKTRKGDIPDCDNNLQSDCFSSTKLTNASPPTTDMMTTPTGLEDVTFQSFLCAGGEVEISNSSHCAQESTVLPDCQDTSNNDSEDTVISDGMMQSCSGHEEHPYFKPEMELCNAHVHEQCVFKFPNAPSVFGDLDEKQATEDSSTLQRDDGVTNVTLKCSVFEGVEVEGTTRIEDGTAPLPKTEQSKLSQAEAENLTPFSDDCSELCQREHADNSFSAPGNNVDAISTHSEIPYDSDNCADGLTNLTFKSLNCTGGEVEILNGTTFADEPVPLTDCHSAITNMSHDDAVEPNMFCGHDLHNDSNHLDHPYCIIQNVSSPPCRSLTSVKDEIESLEMIDSQARKQDGITCHSYIIDGTEAVKSDNIHMSEKTLSLLEDQFLVCQPVERSGCDFSAKDHVRDGSENFSGQHDNLEAAFAGDLSANKEASLPEISLDASANYNLNSYVHKMSKQSHEYVENVKSTRGCHESTDSQNTTHGSSENGPIQSHSENNFDALKVLLECSSGASALPLELLTPVVRRMSQCLLKACADLPQDQKPADDSALGGEKSLLAPVNPHPAGIWVENLETPMPCPLFNSTILDKPRTSPVRELVEDLDENCGAVPHSEVKKHVQDVPLLPEGPLQQQLRQMAEFLFLACGKMSSAPVGASAATTVPPIPTIPLESHNVSVSPNPVKLIDRSLNTSGQFERKREFSVVDSCTLTDPLLWNLSPGTLECLPRQELEQRLMSSMMMVEALVQQLSAARSQQRISAGCSPSDLREKLVQTDHTELSQTTMHRDLYMEALRKIRELEINGTSLQNLKHRMQSMKIDMSALSSDTGAALSYMRQIGVIITEDHQSLASHYGQMKPLFEKSKEVHRRLSQKVIETLQQRDDMKTQMECAFTAKEAAFSAMDQLRTHCATEILELERSLGSQQELLAALKQIYPEQVSLKQAWTETLNSASHLLSQTMDDQASLINELSTVRTLLQKAAPMLLKLNEKAAAALIERDEHVCARDQAIAEREQVEEELNETLLHLRTAKEEIGDLNLQVTILRTENGVLMEKLNEKEEETGQLGRKVTELSAAVSSTSASYTCLKQALAAESTNLQHSLQELKEAKERENELEISLGQSEQHVCDLTQALAASEEQLGQLQALSQSQSAEIQRLQDLCTQLKGVREMNEFLLMENELAREQVLESEGTLRATLQSLRERNIECEDLKGEVCQLQVENKALFEELDTMKSRTRETQTELEEKLSQAATEITLVLHTLLGLTNDLHTILSNQKPELEDNKASQPCNDGVLHQGASSFVSSIMMAITGVQEEEEEVSKKDTTAASESTAVPENRETLFSETSAFTRMATVTPKQSVDEVQLEEEEQNRVAELLSDLSSTVRELVSALNLVQQRKDTELLELQNTVCGLQVEHQTAITRHEAEVSKLQHQLGHLNHQMERGNQALQQKAQDEKMVMKLIADVQEAQDVLNKCKIENKDLRKDASDLRCALQQSKVESQFLREELSKAGGQATHQSHFVEEKIQLLKEVKRLKASLQEAEQARVKFLERAKRHQIIHQNNQQKSENELQVLNHMINRIRETLLSLPEVVKNCKQLQQLLEYIS